MFFVLFFVFAALCSLKSQCRENNLAGPPWALPFTSYTVNYAKLDENFGSKMKLHPSDVRIHIIGSLRSTTRRQRKRHKLCIFNEQKQ